MVYSTQDIFTAVVSTRTVNSQLKVGSRGYYRYLTGGRGGGGGGGGGGGRGITVKIMEYICIYIYIFHPRYLHNDIFRYMTLK